MIIKRFYKILFCLVIVLNAQLVNTSKQTELSSISVIAEFRKDIDDLLNDPNFTNAVQGVFIKSLAHEEYLYKKNFNKLFVPASVVKLFTTSASLLLLGSNYSYRTQFLLDGYIAGNKIAGNLIVKGAGDPSISGRFYSGNLYHVFEDFLAAIQKKGIQEITGNILFDESAFGKPEFGAGWEHEITGEWFAQKSAALCFNDNLLEIKIMPSELHRSAVIKINPDLQYFQIINNVTTKQQGATSKITIEKKDNSRTLIINGEIELGSEGILKLASVENPGDFFTYALKDFLIKNGVKVRGYTADLVAESDYKKNAEYILLHTHKSIPLSKIVEETNKNSNNFYAEQLLKTIGMELFGLGSYQNGIKATKNLFQEMGINSESMLIADGSGISRLNMVSPQHLEKLLSFIYKSNEFESFYNSLPIAGLEGGLAKRMNNTKAENAVRAKPGYISGVKSLCGFADTADNEPVIFGIITNNYLVPSSLASNIEDILCLKIVNFKRNKLRTNDGK